jgi:Ca2+-binding RTX toxin-like protein
MTTSVNIKTTGGSNVFDFTDSVLRNIDLSIKEMAEFEPTFIALTGLDGNKFNLKGTFTFSDPKTTEYSTFTGGTVDVITLVQNPGTKLYATINAPTPIDAVTLLNVLATNDMEGFLALLGDVKFAGGSGGDNFRGGGLGDLLEGNSGADTLGGMAGNDTIRGGAGADNLSGGDGDDWVQGGSGADVMSGGLGIDLLSYKDSSGAVKVSLEGFADWADANGDIISGFENLTGSIFNDVLSGNGADNIIIGGSGNDILSGGTGADRLDGSGGIDTADYSTSRSGVSVNLANRDVAGGATGDVLVSIENVNGSVGKDTLTGSKGVNKMDGLDGDDILDGGKNDDTIEGGTGNDRIVGGAGVDTLFGQDGSDTFVIAPNSGDADYIMDFDFRFDRIEVKASLFDGGLHAGDILTSVEVEVNTTGLASTKETRFILNSLTGDLYFDIIGSTGADSGSRVVAHLSGNLNGFGGGDFVIV